MQAGSEREKAEDGKTPNAQPPKKVAQKMIEATRFDPREAKRAEEGKATASPVRVNTIVIPKQKLKKR
jgi:hypothetical protein